MKYPNNIYFLLNLNEVTDNMIALSQSTSIMTSRVSKPNISGDKFIVLKFKVDKVPVCLVQNNGEDIISYHDLLLELGGSIWN